MIGLIGFGVLIFGISMIICGYSCEEAVYVLVGILLILLSMFVLGNNRYQTLKSTYSFTNPCVDVVIYGEN